jgi:superfamily I DNA/RNA helicase
LLEADGVNPEAILVLTFTRTAAQDLVSKLAGLGSPRADRVVATTIHAFCLRLLQQDAVLTATGRRTRILLEHERDLMLRDLRGAFGNIRERRARLWAFEAGWARRTTDHPGATSDPTDVSFEGQVLRWLRQHEAMLIGEVVPIAFQYLNANPILEERTRFEHVLVDEYQDLNTLEQALVELLVPPAGSLCVIGDDDQSIYRFRYAHPEGIQLFVGDPRTEPQSIGDCLRCPTTVVDMANALISRAPGRTRPPLRALPATAGETSIVQWASLDEEESSIAAMVSGDIARGLHEPGDYLILTQRRQIGYRIREQLVAAGVPSHSYFQDNALAESPEAQGRLALLRLLVDDQDAVSLRVWLGQGDADGRADSYSRVRDIAAAEGVAPKSVVQDVVDGRRQLSIRALVTRFRELDARLAILGPLTVIELVDELFPTTDPELSLMRELADIVGASAPTADDLLRGILAALTQPEVPQSPDFVRVMSLHKSKGLTSPVVVIAASLDGILPTVSGTAPLDEQEAAIEEQRRLFYVAITRAAAELVISYPRALPVAQAYRFRVAIATRFRTAGEWWARTIPSRYIAELGPAAPTPLVGADWLVLRA